MYRIHDRTVTLSNSSTEVDSNLTSSLNNVPATTDSSKNDDSDVLFSSSTPTILPSQAVDKLTTKELFEGP